MAEIMDLLRSAVGSPYPAAAAKILSFGSLDRGWNGHKAARIPTTVQTQALEFLISIWNKFGTSVAEPTEVAPTSDGGVALEWIVKEGVRDKGIEIIVFDRHSEFTVRDRADGTIEQDAESVDFDFLLRNVIDRYVSGHFILAKQSPQQK